MKGVPPARRPWRLARTALALLWLSGCALAPWQRGALIGAAAGAAGGAVVGSQIKSGEQVIYIQPDPRQPPIPQVVSEGSSHTVTGLLIGTLAGAALGALIGQLFARGELAYLEDHVLAAIPLESLDSMRTLADELARSHRLAVLEVNALASSGDGVLAFRILDGLDVGAKVAELGADSRVRFAQPDFVFAVASEMNAAPLAYGPRLIGADRLRGHASGQGITIALVDTGLDGDHVRFKGRILESLDVTGQGFTPDLHGTLLAGIIAAQPSNEEGMDGVAPGAQLLAVKACQPDSPSSTEARCWSLTLAKGIDLAVQKGARVINLSVTGPKDRLLPRVVDAAVSKGSFVVAAAGNGGPQGPPAFPAALENVTAVTAVDAGERLYERATHGSYVALSAPGVEVLSTAPRDKYLVSSGTSLATAHVAGAAALLLELWPRLTPLELQTLFEQTAKDLGPPGKDPLFGSGLVDVCRAAGRLDPTVTPCH